MTLDRKDEELEESSAKNPKNQTVRTVSITLMVKKEAFVEVLFLDGTFSCFKSGQSILGESDVKGWLRESTNYVPLLK